MRVPFVGASNTSRSVQISAQRSVNWYPEIDPHAKYQVSMLPRPGLKTFTNAGAAEMRGARVLGDSLYVVVGDTLKKITTGGAVSTIGTLNTSTGTVSMATNLTQLGLVDGVNGYYTTGSTLTTISDADFPDTATHIVTIDGYGVVNDPSNAGRFFITAKNDFSTVVATDFATAERSPDALKAVLEDHRELWLFGESTTEVWYNSGNADFPFEPVPSGFTEWGIAAPHSAAKIDNSVLWVGKGLDGQGTVFRAEGLRGERISTHAMEAAVAGYSTISDAIGGTFVFQGHYFYVLTFPTGDATWIYDLTTGLWHEWESDGGRFRGQHPVPFNGKIYVGDKTDGNIFELSGTTYTDNGKPMRRMRQDRSVVDGSSRDPLFHRRLEVEFESGTGTATLDPQIAMQYSDDGGHTWSMERWRGVGKVRKYKNRTVWRNLGRSRDRIYRLTTTDDFKAALNGGFLDID
jgi:hypothetical protein